MRPLWSAIQKFSRIILIPYFSIVIFFIYYIIHAFIRFFINSFIISRRSATVWRIFQILWCLICSVLYDFVLGDRSQLSLNLSDGITGSLQKNKKSGKVQKLPPRPEDYDDYWYQDEGGEWRNEYDDEGYVFADDEYDPDEAEEIVQAIKKEGRKDSNHFCFFFILWNCG